MRMRFGLMLAAALLLLWGAGTTVHGHAGTGTPILANQDLGSHRIFVWVDPLEPRAGEEFHVALALTESLPGDETGFAGNAVLNADVTVIMRHAQGEELTDKATHEKSINRVFYEAEFLPNRAGEWAVEIVVATPQGDEGISFVQTVAEVAEQSWLLPVSLGGGGLLLAGALFVLYRRRVASVQVRGGHA
jgi:hypothetical protein